MIKCFHFPSPISTLFPFCYCVPSDSAASSDAAKALLASMRLSPDKLIAHSAFADTQTLHAAVQCLQGFADARPYLVAARKFLSAHDVTTAYSLFMKARPADARPAFLDFAKRNSSIPVIVS